MKIFSDDESQDAHEEFQRWRRENEAGFFINCRTKNDLMLHRVLCPHHGDTTWARSDGASLTKRPKVCSINRQELVNWARAQSKKLLKICNDCAP